MQTILRTKTKTNIIHTEELRKQYASYLHIAYSTANTGNHMKGINHAITKTIQYKSCVHKSPQDPLQLSKQTIWLRSDPHLAS